MPILSSLPYKPPVHPIPFNGPGRVLVACEFSGIVREAFKDQGHDAWSCDFLPTETPGQHYQGNMWDIIDQDWDLIIVHPTCTQLCNSGNSRWADTLERDLALEGIRKIMAIDCLRLAIENPVGAINTRIRKPDQIIQPWMFGHGETKATCFWLRGLPRLVPTNIVSGRKQRVYMLRDGHQRYPSENWRARTRWWPGVAKAMAEQWGAYGSQESLQQRTGAQESADSPQEPGTRYSAP